MCVRDALCASDFAIASRYASQRWASGTAPLAALPFDPQGPAARAYLAALRSVGPAQSGTAAGLAAFLEARGERFTGPPVIYAATTGFHVMPMGEGSGGHAAGSGWLAGGALTPVTAPLATRDR